MKTKILKKIFLQKQHSMSHWCKMNQKQITSGCNMLPLNLCWTGPTSLWSKSCTLTTLLTAKHQARATTRDTGWESQLILLTIQHHQHHHHRLSAAFYLVKLSPMTWSQSEIYSRLLLSYHFFVCSWLPPSHPLKSLLLCHDDSILCRAQFRCPLAWLRFWCPLRPQTWKPLPLGGLLSRIS